MRRVSYAPSRLTLLCLAFHVFSALAAHAQPAQGAAGASGASMLVADERGILWFERGRNDDRHPVALAAALSQRAPYFVIFVSTTAEHEADAVAHAERIRDWFQKQEHMPRKIDIVAARSAKQTFYSFQLSGLFYKHEDHAPDGVMSPQTTYQVLENAVVDYRACMILRSEGEFDFIRVREVAVLRN